MWRLDFLDSLDENGPAMDAAALNLPSSLGRQEQLSRMKSIIKPIQGCLDHRNGMRRPCKSFLYLSMAYTRLII